MQNRNTFSWVKEQMTRSIYVSIMIYVITRASISNAYPIFAQQGYENPREATGRIICANCHLANKHVDIKVPQVVLPETVFETVRILYDNTQNQLARGQRLHELLKQSQSNPLAVEDQIATIYTGTNGYLDALEIGQVKKFLVRLRSYLTKKKPKFQNTLSSTKIFTEEAETLLREPIQEHIKLFLHRKL